MRPLKTRGLSPLFVRPPARRSLASHRTAEPLHQRPVTVLMVVVPATAAAILVHRGQPGAGVIDLLKSFIRRRCPQVSRGRHRGDKYESQNIEKIKTTRRTSKRSMFQHVNEPYEHMLEAQCEVPLHHRCRVFKTKVIKRYGESIRKEPNQPCQYKTLKRSSLREAARSHPSKDRPKTLPVQCALIPCSR